MVLGLSLDVGKIKYYNPIKGLVIQKRARDRCYWKASWFRYVHASPGALYWEGEGPID